MSRQFADWIKALDELEPKGVQQETRLAPDTSTSGTDAQRAQHQLDMLNWHRNSAYFAPAQPVSRFSFSLAIVELAGFYLMAAVCVGLFLYDLWLVFS